MIWWKLMFHVFFVFSCRDRRPWLSEAQGCDENQVISVEKKTRNENKHCFGKKQRLKFGRGCHYGSDADENRECWTLLLLLWGMVTRFHGGFPSFRHVQNRQISKKMPNSSKFIQISKRTLSWRKPESFRGVEILREIGQTLLICTKEQLFADIRPIRVLPERFGWKKGPKHEKLCWNCSSFSKVFLMKTVFSPVPMLRSRSSLALSWGHPSSLDCKDGGSRPLWFRQQMYLTWRYKYVDVLMWSLQFFKDFPNALSMLSRRNADQCLKCQDYGWDPSWSWQLQPFRLWSFWKSLKKSPK